MNAMHTASATLAPCPTVAAFAAGPEVGIDEVLANRDRRAAVQQKLVEEHPHDAIVAVKFNVPGPVKTSPTLSAAFDLGVARLITGLRHIGGCTVLQAWSESTGSECFLGIAADVVAVKRAAVAFESADALGRLFDVDVLTRDASGSAVPMSRTEIGARPRVCFICGMPAKECARNRTHQVAALQRAVGDIIDRELSGADGQELEHARPR